METLDILSRCNYLKEEEKKVTDEVKELLDRFNQALEYKEKERLRLEDEISKLTANRNETKENLRVVTKNISVYEVNLARVRERLDELETKGTAIKKYYEDILTGPVSNIVTFKGGDYAAATGAPLLSGETPKEGEGVLNEETGAELLRKKKEFMTAMDTIFGRYESEIGEIEDEKKRLKEIENSIMKKDEETKRQRELLTNSLKAYTDEIERCRERLESSVKEEMNVIEEFTRIIKNIDRAVIVSDEVKDILNKVSAAF